MTSGCNHCVSAGRRSFLRSAAGFAAVGITAATSNLVPAEAWSASNAAYADPATPGLENQPVALDLRRTALVVIDPQIDFMSPKSPAWPVVGESVTEQGTVPNLVKLFRAAKSVDIPVIISPHYYYPWDHSWKVQGPLELLQHRLGMFDRHGPLDLDGFEGSGAEWMPEFKEFIEDGKTIVCSPHKLYGPQANDLMLQLGKQGVNQVILAGMAANLCVESHLRQMLEFGMQVVVVRDAIAAAKLPEGDGYASALVNFRFIANGLWTTDETVSKLNAA